MNIQVDISLGYHVFKHFFVCFALVRDHFVNGCKPFIEVDGCFLKRPFGGQLLAALSLDSSSGMFPIVMAVVELECKNSWTFFMTHLETMIGNRNIDNIPWTFMSDRQKVIVLLLFCFSLTYFD